MALTPTVEQPCSLPMLIHIPIGGGDGGSERLQLPKLHTAQDQRRLNSSLQGTEPLLPSEHSLSPLAAPGWFGTDRSQQQDEEDPG